VGENRGFVVIRQEKECWTAAHLAEGRHILLASFHTPRRAGLTAICLHDDACGTTKRMTTIPGHTFSNKADARAFGLRLRKSWTPTQHRAMGDAMIRRLLSSAMYLEAATVLTYLGTKSGEVDTLALVEAAWKDGKTVLVPLTRSGGQMDWALLAPETALVRTSLGLLEPQPDATRCVAPAGGLCLVPGVCFRADGHRVGFGGGYFDRFLATFPGKPVAMCPDALYGVVFPVESHDVPVSAVFTESAHYDTAGTTS